MGFWSKLFGKKSADQAQADEVTAKPTDEDTEKSADVSQDESDE